jgi:predicted HicB family RNase H-like nuclease
VLRVPPPVHQALALQAKAAGKSLNTYCAERLARYGS